MSRVLGRISNAFNWRRGVLLVATIGIAMVLVERDRRLRAWHGEVARAAESLVAGEGRATDWAVPGAEVVARDAIVAVAALSPPRRIAPVMPVEEATPRRAVVKVTGSDGRAVMLDWAGVPPRIVAVTRVDVPATFRPATEETLSGDDS